MNYAIAIIASYLLGAIPFGLLIGLMRGVDIREVGSKNTGATNVFRTVGKGWGLLAFVLDFAKGFAAAWFCGRFCDCALLGGAAAVVGHNWPIYIKFRGGKGVATTAGMLAALAPEALGLALLAWIAVVTLSRIVSLASITAAIVLAILVWLSHFSPADGSVITSAVITLLALIAIARHHKNIGRLLRGEEARFGKNNKKKNNRPCKLPF